MQLQTSMAASVDPAVLRRTVVDCQIRPFGVTDQPALARFLDVPREAFAPVGAEHLAYSDLELRHPLGSGASRAMLLPLVLARMIQAAEIRAEDVVLDVAGATGYTAALAAGLARKVYALESDATLAASAKANFAALGLANVEGCCGPLREGPAGKGPFDVIFVDGVVEEGLDTLLSTLSPAGRMLALEPGAAGTARVVLWRRDGSNFSRRELFEAAGKALPEFARQPGFAF